MTPRVPSALHGRSLRRGAVALCVCAILLGTVVAPLSAYAATVSELKQQLAALRREAEPAGDAYERALTAVEDTQYRIKQTDARIKSASKKLTAAEDLLGARADSLYREGGEMGVFEFILGAATWEDFVTRLDYIMIIAASDATLIKNVKDTRTALQADRVQLVADAKVEKKDLAVAARDRDILERQLSAKRLQYDRLMAALAAQSGGSHPPGPNGMVFPVRGVHYYSNTWGAPRMRR